MVAAGSTGAPAKTNVRLRPLPLAEGFPPCNITTTTHLSKSQKRNSSRIDFRLTFCRLSDSSSQVQHVKSCCIPSTDTSLFPALRLLNVSSADARFKPKHSHAPAPLAGQSRAACSSRRRTIPHGFEHKYLGPRGGSFRPKRKGGRKFKRKKKYVLSPWHRQEQPPPILRPCYGIRIGVYPRQAPYSLSIQTTVRASPKIGR